MTEQDFNKISQEAKIVEDNNPTAKVENTNPYNNGLGNQIIPNSDYLERNLTGQYTLIRKGKFASGQSIYTLSGELQKVYKLIIWATSATAFSLTLRINGDDISANYKDIYHGFGISGGSAFHDKKAEIGTLPGMVVTYPAELNKFIRTEIDIYGNYSQNIQCHAETIQYTDGDNFIHTQMDGIYNAGGTAKIVSLRSYSSETITEGYYWLYKINKP